MKRWLKDIKKIGAISKFSETMSECLLAALKCNVLQRMKVIFFNHNSLQYSNGIVELSREQRGGHSLANGISREKGTDKEHLVSHIGRTKFLEIYSKGAMVNLSRVVRYPRLSLKGSKSKSYVIISI